MEYIILWILALFGLWSLISNILDSLFSSNMRDCFDVELEVHNKEDSLELLIRQLSRIDMIGSINVHDNNSTDNTLKIMKEVQKNNSKVVIKD